MRDYIWPWQSNVMLKHPWALPILFLILSVILSFVTWSRSKHASQGQGQKEQQQPQDMQQEQQKGS
ncbi:hypothetical protein [Paenibacillus sp. NPDC058174]|uniref:hypothetical protein n=1 Tax=Paenibacillus sp. NPDC058174 TaxID=3346366 RepID=UPI0036DAD950